MMKFEAARQAHSLLVRSTPHDLHLYPLSSLLSTITNFLTSSPNRAYTTTSTTPLLTNFLMKSLEYSPHEAAVISGQVRPILSTQKPESVVSYLKTLGLSTAHLQSVIKRQPKILFVDVDKILKPKVEFCRELGLSEPLIPVLISKNPTLLVSSLDKKLKPSIGVIMRVLERYYGRQKKDTINLLVFRILSRYSWVIVGESRLESNIAYLRSCGIVGSQLIMLLKTELRLFSMREPDLKDLISQAIKMGFKKDSRMLVYGVLALYSNKHETIIRKFEVFLDLGFTRVECDLMFLKSPTLFKASEGKLRRGVEFFTRTLGFDRSLLVGSPSLLMFSVEKRMIPRLRVIEMLKSRGVFDKEPSFITVLVLTEREFVSEFVTRFDGDAEELKAAYEKWCLVAS